MSSPANVLAELTTRLASQQLYVPLAAHLSLTKARPGANSVLFRRRLDIEERVYQPGLNNLLARYQTLAPEHTLVLPQHYAADLVAGEGTLMAGENVFIYFPQCLGLEPADMGEVFGIELINISQQLFRKGPLQVIARLASPATLASLDFTTAPQLESTIFTAAVLHELGHCLGPYRVLPRQDPEIKVSAFHFDILGELWTEALLAELAPEQPALMKYVTLQRLLWYPRRGFLAQPRSGLANVDNDALIGLLLWNRLEQEGALAWQNRQLSITWDKVATSFARLRVEISALAETLWGRRSHEQDALVHAWLRQQVSYQTRYGFVMADSQRQAFLNCLDLAEVPTPQF